LTEQAATTAIDTACRLLRLPSIRNEFSDIADRALKDQMTYRGFLAELLMAECDDRSRRRSERRIKAAGFPRDKSLRTFDFDANPNIDAATIHTLASCEWIKKSRPLCLIGDSGTGKSHMLIALGTEAAMAGYRVKYVLATKLVNELVEAADEKQLSKTIARYGRVDLLCIDELGYMELDRRGAELLFQVLTEREEKNSVAIASNESFGGWTKTFTDPRLCAAIVDRLTFNGTIIETGTDSYRLASTRARAEESAKTGWPLPLPASTARRPPGAGPSAQDAPVGCAGHGHADRTRADPARRDRLWSADPEALPGRHRRSPAGPNAAPSGDAVQLRDRPRLEQPDLPRRVLQRDPPPGHLPALHRRRPRPARGPGG
jgi:DNA replication protein DnaC